MTNPKPANTPLVLVIRDGWGQNPHPDHDAFNAIKLAKTPVAKRIEADCPTTLVATSGEDVGLTDGTMGNSEVGHQNIGAGRIVDQDAVRITRVCRENRLDEIEAIDEAVLACKERGATLHLMGIASDAGVHGQLVHLYAILNHCKDRGLERVCIHLFTDGRDTGPFTGKGYAEEIESMCAKIGVGKIASVVGRYWAMDRDNRWERVQKAYELLVGTHEVPHFGSASAAIQDYYDLPTPGLVGDEFVEPRTVGTPGGTLGGTAADSRVKNGDAVIFYNYRGDRPREICSAFLMPHFFGSDELTPSPDSGTLGFDRGDKLELDFVIMTPYSERLAELARVAFPKPPKMVDIGGEYLSKLGLTQFRCAETEKYPHVTFFFNDYRDEPFAGERREIIQSPKVATYDLQPEMSARGVADAVLRRLDADDCEDVIVVNFANGDMVGHTGSLDAAVRACETVDALTGEIIDRALARGGSLIVTADHGNAEQMFNPDTDAPHTAHTLFPVPLSIVGEPFAGRSLRDGGGLADIFPTMLDMMGIDQPTEMAGRSLLA
ncbi:MAG: 2,3-bisphosphoglycerate-independent phosphoglycerate mutase [Planctomycetota bacterium]